MTDWEPATEAEAALRDALRAGDQELYFRILSHVELLLPMSSAALSPRAGTGWGTWTSGGRTHVLAFTSPQAMTTCLAEHGGAARRMAYADLAGAWPNPEWWLAINPGLPIEGYLPAWFVSQLSRGDVRLPGRTIGARARVEAAAAAQAGGTPVPMSALAASAAARAAYARSVPPQPGAHQAPDAAPPRSAPTGRARVPAHAAPEPEPEHEPRRLTAIPPRPVLPSRTMAPPRAPTSPPRTPTPPAPTPPPPAPTTPPPPPPGAPAWRPGMPLPVRTPAEPAASFNPIGQAQPPAPPSPAPTPPAPAPSVPASPVPAPPAPAPSVPASPAPAPSPSIGRPRVIEGAIVEESRPAHAAAPSRPASSAPAARPEPYPLGTGADPTYVISTGRESGYPPPRAATVPPVDVERTQRVPPAEALTRPAARAETTTRSEPTTRSETTTRADTLTGSRAATRAARSGYPPSRDLDLDPSRDVDPGRDLGAGRDQTTGRRSDAARTDAARTDAARSDAGWLDAARAEPGRESGRARDRAPAATPPPEPATDRSATDRSATDRRATDRPATDEAATDRPDEADFTPANNVETELLAAAGDGQTDHFLSTLLLAKVLIPIPPKAPAGVRPGEPGFAWRREQVEGQPYMVVFTSTERMTEYLGAETDVVEAKFVQLISAWPDESWSFAVNPGTPVGATLPGVQIKALAVWAAEVGLTDQPAVEEGQPEMPVAGTEPEPAQRPVVMQKAISAAQVRYYLDRGYDRVSGFVQRASEVEHLTTPGQLYEALGLGYPQSPFTHDADEIYLLRWTAYRPDLYRIPFGGRDETSMRAMQGWVIERGPFRGNGFAPGETNDVIAEFKVDSARLPHGAQMWRMRRGRKETLVAMLDADGPRWRPVGADNEAAELD